MNITKNHLKHFALSNSLFPPSSLKKAIETLKFVQIDPIKSPACAQDLILRHRVNNYCVGDIDRNYENLGLEEDFLYAHGYMTRDVWQLLHPRNNIQLTEFDMEILEAIKTHRTVNIKILEQTFEKKHEESWWGRKSNSIKMSIERLHYYGFLRVEKRQKGVRVYQVFTAKDSTISVDERIEIILKTIIRIMQPVTSTTLSQSLHRVHRHFGHTKNVFSTLIKSGEVIEKNIEGVRYLWLDSAQFEQEIGSSVKFLAPFDPVVRDRIRFEHLWSWLYQFEAYVPKEKRIRGYYAMPILWNTQMVGWANIKAVKKELHTELGFKDGRPNSSEFEKGLELEIDRMKTFLELG